MTYLYLSLFLTMTALRSGPVRFGEDPRLHSGNLAKRKMSFTMYCSRLAESTTALAKRHGLNEPIMHAPYFGEHDKCDLVRLRRVIQGVVSRLRVLVDICEVMEHGHDIECQHFAIVNEICNSSIWKLLQKRRSDTLDGLQGGGGGGVVQWDALMTRVVELSIELVIEMQGFRLLYVDWLESRIACDELHRRVGIPPVVFDAVSLFR